jgi:hypothetical protein
MAKLSHAELAARFDLSTRTRLVQLVDLCVSGVAVPTDLSAEEFAQWIHDLRDSERDWNRSLGIAILSAEDAHAAGDAACAAKLLRDFASQCAWLPLRDIAEGEALRHERT